jgi:organic hydroperoxide reductase OsmC/OhrA
MPLINGTAISKMARPPRPGANSSCYQGVVSMVAGQEIKLETSPDGEELLAITCPEGKVWRVSVRVDLAIDDA